MTDQGAREADLAALLGEQKTPGGWVATAKWWLAEVGDALPGASPMFKALVNAVRENEALKAEVQRVTQTAMDRDDVLFEIGKTLDQYNETLFSLSSDETSVAGSGAAVEITGRSWDPKAAGRRAVEKHADALKRLSDEEGRTRG